MNKCKRLVSLWIVLMAVNAEAQNTFPATGKVGIGTSSPAAPLHVVGTELVVGQALIGENSNGTAVIDAYGGNAYYGNNTATNGIAVNASGYVGIGTSSPGYPLTIGNSGTAGINFASFIQTNLSPGQLNSIALGHDISPYNCGALQFTYIGAGSKQNFTSLGNCATNQTLNVLASGNVGIGTSNPQGRFHVLDTVGSTAAGSLGLFGSANVVIQSNYGGRTAGTGAALSFAFPANTDGTNLYEQARIVGTPDNSVTSNASGRMYLQTRYINSTGWAWRNNLILTSDGSVTAGGNLNFAVGSGGSMTFQDGTVQSTAWNGVLSGGDYAESVNVSGGHENYEPGDVLVIDPAFEGNFLRSSAPYSTTVTGIYSTKPGIVGRRQLTASVHMKEEVPMAMTGIVPTKVSAENGPIKPGDLLVTSSKLGYAMKGTDRTQMLGAVIGKAIGHLNSGVGLIEAVVTLQ